MNPDTLPAASAVLVAAQPAASSGSTKKMKTKKAAMNQLQPEATLVKGIKETDISEHHTKGSTDHTTSVDQDAITAASNSDHTHKHRDHQTHVVSDSQQQPSGSGRTSVNSSDKRSTSSRRPSSIREKYLTPKSKLPAYVKTRIHPGRILFFFSLFVLPYGIGLATLFSRDVYRAIGVRDIRISLLTATEDFEFGFFDFCTAPTAGIAPPDPTLPGAIPNYQVCMTYVNYCKSVHFQTAFDAGVTIDPQFCSPRWQTIVALEIIASVAGFLVLVFLVDNVLVWQGVSCWFRPKSHTKQEVSRLRSRFRRITIAGVIVHGATQAIAMGILFDLQRHYIKWPTGLDFHWGVLAQGISWVADGVFVLLFLFLDRFTFFVETEWDLDDVNRSSENPRSSGELPFTGNGNVTVIVGGTYNSNTANNLSNHAITDKRASGILSDTTLDVSAIHMIRGK